MLVLIFSFEIVSPCHSLDDENISYYRLSYDSPATIMNGPPYSFVQVDGEKEGHTSGSHKTRKKLKESLNFFRTASFGGLDTR
jgi:hypothetical protein